MNNRYRNLWRSELIRHAPEFYENDAKQVTEHRGVKVYRLHSKSFDYVLAGVCIAQRGGCGSAIDVIDEILDGRKPVADKVAAHVKAQGFTPLSYTEDTALLVS